MDVVINSVSEGVSEGGNLLLEDVNDPFKISEFTVSSVGLLVEESFFGGEVVLGINNILVRLSGEGPGIFLGDEGDFEVDGELFEVGVSLDGVGVESGDFGLGLDLILGSVEGGLDLVGFEGGGTFFEMSLESVKHSVNLIVKGTNEVGGIDGGFEFGGVELISVSVLVTGLGSSGGSLINILEVGFVSVGIGDVNTLAGVTGSLEELFHGVNLEEMFVLRELVGEGTFGLGEDGSLAGGLGSIEFGSEDEDQKPFVLCPEHVEGEVKMSY